MNITQHTDYALRVLIYVGANPERRVTIGEISERYEISRSHLMKVVNKLVHEGFLAGTRGKGGGLGLGRAADAIRIGDVVQRMEPNMTLVECFSENNACLIDPACKLKGALNQALKAFLDTLNQYTLAELLQQPRTLKLLQLQMPASSQAA